jgi:hypothetical protein
MECKTRGYAGQQACSEGRDRHPPAIAEISLPYAAGRSSWGLRLPVQPQSLRPLLQLQQLCACAVLRCCWCFCCCSAVTCREGRKRQLHALSAAFGRMLPTHLQCSDWGRGGVLCSVAGHRLVPPCSGGFWQPC